MAAGETVIVQDTFARQDGAYGALCTLPNKLAITVVVPERFDVGTAIVAKREGSHWAYVGRYASEPQRLP